MPALATVAAQSAGLLLGVLALSFLFWILVAYSAFRFVKFGLCSVCGAVTTVWAANLLFHFLPDWMGLLLMGQSAVGGATLARDLLFARRIQSAPDSETRRSLTVRAQLAWFGLLLCTTVGLGTLWLAAGQRPPTAVPAALAATGLLAAVLVGAYAVWVLVMYASARLTGWTFCQVCAAVSSVWVANLLFGFFPAWVTIFLMGQSIAGVAGMGRDWAAGRFGLNGLPETRRRLAKQFTYFGFILLGTLGAVLVALATRTA